MAAYIDNNYALQTLQNDDTRPRLQNRTQNICFVISISAVILKLMVKITSIFGSYRFLRIACNDIFSLSHHLLASWNLYIPRVAGSKSKCSSSREVKRLDGSKALELKSLHCVKDSFIKIWFCRSTLYTVFWWVTSYM